MKKEGMSRRSFLTGAATVGAAAVAAPALLASCSGTGKLTPLKKEGEYYVPELPDNWEQNRLMNMPLDTLRSHIDSALHHRHPICWESRGHAMAIVGIAHNDRNEPYFIMKNSWGTDGPYKGLDYLSFDDFKTQTLAVELPRFVVYASN